MMRTPRNCPHCMKALRPEEFDMHLRFFCANLRGRQPQSNVINLRPTPAVYDWAADPEMNVDDCPPHGILREFAGVHGWLRIHVG
jgi:hypothetical protein